MIRLNLTAIGQETRTEVDLHKFEIDFIDKITKSLTITSFSKFLLWRIPKTFKDSYTNTQIEYGFERSRPDPLALEDLRTREIILSDKTVANLSGNLRFELLEGLKNKEPIDDIKRRLDKIFKGVNTERIARNEILTSQKIGRIKAYMDANIWGRKWIAAKGPRTCDICRKLNGQVAKMDEWFKDPKTGEDLINDMAHIQCRCTTIPLRKDPADNESY